jgi:hypothetical protein
VTPSKQKGTGGEREIKLILEELFGREFRRTSPGCAWDMETVDSAHDEGPIEVLATRPDRGQWLVSMPPKHWWKDPYSQEIRVEVKRYKKHAHHTIYEETF